MKIVKLLFFLLILFSISAKAQYANSGAEYLKKQNEWIDPTNFQEADKSSKAYTFSKDLPVAAGEDEDHLEDLNPCADWLQITANGSGVRIGDADVAGQKITVEAVINRTEPYSGGRLYAGNIVSKHSGPSTTNYLLRPNSAEITTSNGYFITPPVCDIELNKTYHVAMVYDGSTLKFYRNGFLMSQVACSGDLYQNDFLTTIGAKAFDVNTMPDESFRGYINEVRIWNVVRSQTEIRQFMNSSLINPQTQNGLVAYYIFNDLKNKQGNTQWDGNIVGAAQINQANPVCASFVADSCSTIILPSIVIPGFTAPDTVCVNTLFTIKNTSIGGSSYFWNFCNANLNESPVGENLGNPGNTLNVPVYSDIINSNGNYYVFTANNSPSSVVRFDYGNSLLNTPTATTLNFTDGFIPANAEGIQIENVNNQWYAILVGGDPSAGVKSFIIRISFGANIQNNNPSLTNWGNLGNLSYPHDLYLFQDGITWYGFTANTGNSTITRFKFGTDFNLPPAATNLGNIGSLSSPTGIFAMSENNNWYAFITNAISSTLTRLDFGSSLLNTPTGINLGNISNSFHTCWDIYLFKYCDEVKGYIINGADAYSDLLRLDFPSNTITSTPVATSLGNIGNLSFPHCLSKITRIGADLYSFIPNAHNNTITRLKFSGCNDASVPNYSGYSPPEISYNKAGLYNINVAIDEGLSTQTALCHQVVVLDKPPHLPTKDTTFCEGASLRLTRSYSNVTYLWNTGSTDSAIIITTPGKYWVQFNKGYDCSSTDSFNVKGSSNLAVNLGADTGLCTNQTLLLDAANPGNTYLWQDGSMQRTYQVVKGGHYFVKVSSLNGCFLSDTIEVKNYTSPVINTLIDKKVCTGDSVQLIAVTGETGDSFSWQPPADLSNANTFNPFASPKDTAEYFVTVTSANGCLAKDSVAISVLRKPTITTINDTSICNHFSVVLQSAVQNADRIQWLPATYLNNSTISSPLATPASATDYIITANNEACGVKDTVTVNVIKPNISTGNDTTICGTPILQLNAYGGVQYQWSPAIGLSDAAIANPVANISDSIVYTVTGTDENGCVDKDFIAIGYMEKPVFAISSSEAVICKGKSVAVKASGGNVYNWNPFATVSQPSKDSVSIVPDSTTNYTVDITNTVCKVSGQQQIRVTVLPVPAVSLIKSNDIDCSKDSAVLTASGGVSYVWSPATGLSNVNQAATLANPEKDMIYAVTTTGENGCSSTDTIQLKVMRGGKNKYQIATAFTPNGDGLNDCFGVQGWNYLTRLDFSVYDRWGMLLFRTNNVFDCWDGRYKQNPEPAGAYIYKIHAETACGIVDKKGTFVLIR